MWLLNEIKKCCQSIFNIPSCNAIVPVESYIQSCILDAQTSGSYVSSDKMKQTYLAKCRTLTDDMIRGTTKETIDQGTKIRKKCGFGNGTCINSCSGKGTCTDFGCACSPGFSGMDCSMDLTKAPQYDPNSNEYRINVNITIVQQQIEPSYKLPVSVPYATPAPSDPSDPSVPSVPSDSSAPSVPSDSSAPSVSSDSSAPSVSSDSSAPSVSSDSSAPSVSSDSSAPSVSSDSSDPSVSSDSSDSSDSSAPSAPSDSSDSSVPSVTSAPSAPSVLSVLSTPSVDKSLVSFVGYLPKPSAVSPHIAD
ncbi:hypothetical protein BASA83_011074 [Batrachochytrium salamandrivorans]|nr:hypothetical protein BASA83_011074 [Batrachochytrium salamandrivorans]